MLPPSSPRAARAAGAARETLPIARSPPGCRAPLRSRRANRPPRRTAPRQALAELPERRRVPVVLFDVEGYSDAEIAAVLGIPEGTVRSEVFHARRRLRALLADWKEEA